MLDSLDESFLCSVFLGNELVDCHEIFTEDESFHVPVGDVLRFSNFFDFRPILT